MLSIYQKKRLSPIMSPVFQTWITAAQALPCGMTFAGALGAEK
jgi:hypothetical protein